MTITAPKDQIKVLDTKTIIGLAAMVTFTVVANLVLKLGAAAPAAERIFFGVLGWKSMVGLCLFGAAGVIYSVVLRNIPLNVAQAFTAAQYVGVALAANLVLREPMSLWRMVGVGCIALGIFVVGLTARG